MKTNRQKLATVLGGLFLLTGVLPSAGQPANMAPGQIYDGEFRAALMQQGWKPDASYGLKIANGAPLYRFPEVLCGPELCRAKWRDRGGAEHSIMIIRAFNDQPYRVAPQ